MLAYLQQKPQGLLLFLQVVGVEHTRQKWSLSGHWVDWPAVTTFHDTDVGFLEVVCSIFSQNVGPKGI